MDERRKTGFGGVFWQLLCPILIYYAVSMLVSLFASVILMLLHTEELMPYLLSADAGGLTETMTPYLDACYIYIEMATAGLSVPIFLLLMRSDRKRSEAAGFFCRYEKVSPVCYAAAIVWGASVCIVGNHLLIFSRLQELLYSGYEELAGMIYQSKLIPELIAVGIFAPLAEELLFRGLIYRRLRRFAGVKTAVISSALCFGLVHMNLLQGIYAFLLGILLAYACERFRSVLAPFCIHAGANIMSVIVTETDLFHSVYENDLLFLAVSAAAVLVFLGLAYYLLTHVDPRPLQAASEEDSPADNAV